MMRALVATTALLVVPAVAAAGCDEGSDSPSGGEGGATATSSCASPPDYSDNCAEVSYFECGFMATCDGASITAEWHVHLLCGEREDIASYSCTYDCPEACDSEWSDWPQDGAELVAGMCTSAGGAGGGAGSGGMAGAAAGSGGGGGAAGSGG